MGWIYELENMESSIEKDVKEILMTMKLWKALISIILLKRI